MDERAALCLLFSLERAAINYFVLSASHGLGFSMDGHEK